MLGKKSKKYSPNDGLMMVYHGRIRKNHLETHSEILFRLTMDPHENTERLGLPGSCTVRVVAVSWEIRKGSNISCLKLFFIKAIFLDVGYRRWFERKWGVNFGGIYCDPSPRKNPENLKISPTLPETNTAHKIDGFQ